MTARATQICLWILVIIAGLAVLVFLFRPTWRHPKILTLPPPLAEGTPSQTHYVGSAALDVPSTFQLMSLQAVFYYIDPSDKTATITVSERLKSLRATLTGGSIRFAHQLEEVDVSSKFGRPAKVYAGYEDRFVPPYILKPSLGETENFPNPVLLEIVLLTEEPWGLMEYRYERLLDKAETNKTGGWWRIGLTALVELAEDISKTYQWTGKNEQPAGSGLAMKFGRFVPPADQPDWKVDFNGRFITPDNDPGIVFFGPTLDVSIEGVTGRPDTVAAGGRTVGGHPGNEKREWLGLFSNNYERLARKPRRFTLNLNWRDGSSLAPTSRNPNYTADFYYNSNTRDSKKIADYLRVWETVLSSIRLAASGPAAGLNGDQAAFAPPETGQ